MNFKVGKKRLNIDRHSLQNRESNSRQPNKSKETCDAAKSKPHKPQSIEQELELDKLPSDANQVIPQKAMEKNQTKEQINMSDVKIIPSYPSQATKQLIPSSTLDSLLSSSSSEVICYDLFIHLCKQEYDRIKSELSEYPLFDNMLQQFIGQISLEFEPFKALALKQKQDKQQIVRENPVNLYEMAYSECINQVAEKIMSQIKQLDDQQHLLQQFEKYLNSITQLQKSTKNLHYDSSMTNAINETVSKMEQKHKQASNALLEKFEGINGQYQTMQKNITNYENQIDAFAQKLQSTYFSESAYAPNYRVADWLQEEIY